MISLVAFLGNTGREYERTRHNAAWIAADRLTICAGIAWQRKFRGLYGRFPAQLTGGRAVHVLKPETYMNLSGDCVGEAAQFFKIPPEEILIVHDELELLPAVLSLKWSGGLGGHNGLRSVKAALGTADFWRLRIGIGRPDNKHTKERAGSAENGTAGTDGRTGQGDADIASYVLSPFSQAELNVLLQTVPVLETLFSLLFTEQKEPESLLKAWTKVQPER
ncbi:MAG: aminoacyl-tRNA hydrolase [Treponema sp.]